MASQGKVASRYAKALFEELQGKKNADKVLEELSTFSATVNGHKELTLVVNSPGFSEKQKTGVMTDVAEKLKLSKETIRILTILSRGERLPALPAIVERLRLKLRQSEDIQLIDIRTSEAVSVDDKKQIEGKFSRLFGKKVEATYEINPSLVGGLKVVAGGRTFDGTVSGWLESLEERLVEGEV